MNKRKLKKLVKKLVKQHPITAPFEDISDSDLQKILVANAKILIPIIKCKNTKKLLERNNKQVRKLFER